MFRKISGPKREGYGSWRKLHNDELHSLYSSLNIVRVIKSSRMKWRDMWNAWGRGKVFRRFLFQGPKGRNHWEDQGVVGGGGE
jgi:hypothetical protein